MASSSSVTMQRSTSSWPVAIEVFLVERRFQIVAIKAIGRSVTVGVGRLPARDDSVTVRVQIIADLCQARSNARVLIITVPRAFEDAIAVLVVLAVENRAVAVVVLAVTEFGSVWIDRWIAIVAVALAGEHAIAVDVLVPRRQRTVAIVIHAVAQLWCPRVRGLAGVIAVTAAPGVSVRIGIGLEEIYAPIAVVIQAGVTDVRRAGVDERRPVVAIPLADHPPIRVPVVLVASYRAVAVIIDSVALLRRTRVNVGIRVVAVGAVGGEPVVAVPVGIGQIGPIAVLVDAIVRRLLRTGIRTSIPVVTVPIAAAPSVPVGVLRGQLRIAVVAIAV